MSKITNCIDCDKKLSIIRNHNTKRCFTCARKAIADRDAIRAKAYRDSMPLEACKRCLEPYKRLGNRRHCDECLTVLQAPVEPLKTQLPRPKITVFYL